MQNLPCKNADAACPSHFKHFWEVISIMQQHTQIILFCTSSAHPRDISCHHFMEQNSTQPQDITQLLRGSRWGRGSSAGRLSPTHFLPNMYPQTCPRRPAAFTALSQHHNLHRSLCINTLAWRPSTTKGTFFMEWEAEVQRDQGVYFAANDILFLNLSYTFKTLPRCLH